MFIARKQNVKWLALLLACLGNVGAVSSCTKEGSGDKPSGEKVGYEVPNVPSTSIDPDLVGTWYPVPTLNRPLSEDWANDVFTGEQGFADFRTMVFTADGENAIEYKTDVRNGSNGEAHKYFFKYKGKLTQGPGRTITFRRVSGHMRAYVGNKKVIDKPMPKQEFDQESYHSVISECVVTTSNGVTTLTAKRSDGSINYSVTYRKASGSTTPLPIGQPYSTPPATGTHVKIGSQYYPTVTVGNKEWTLHNYAGPSPLATGSVAPYKVLEDGNYYSWWDVKEIAKTLPVGWRVPTKQDYVALLASQGITFTPDESMPSDYADEYPDASANAVNLYKLLSTNRWPGSNVNGESINASKFALIPAGQEYSNQAPANNYNSTGALWTSSFYNNESNKPWVLRISRRTNGVILGFVGTTVGGTYESLYPVRFVKDK